MKMSDMLSQEEINALLGGAATDENSDSVAGEEGVDSQDNKQPNNSQDNSSIVLNSVELDALGEIGNISMGTAATTLFTLLNNKVEITAPQVSQTTVRELAKTYDLPFVSVFVRYSLGIEGVNLLILK